MNLNASPYLKSIIKKKWGIWFNNIKLSQPNILNITDNFWYLFQNMLNFNPEERYTIKNTMKDIWLQDINTNYKEIRDLFK